MIWPMVGSRAPTRDECLIELADFLIAIADERNDIDSAAA